MPEIPIVILRFPDGDVEHRTTQGELPVGALVRARGCLWRVRAYAGGAAILEPDEASDGAVGGPVALPDAFDDTPLTLEVLAVA